MPTTEKNPEFVTINGNENEKYEAIIDSTFGYMDLHIKTESHSDLRAAFKKVSSLKIYPDNKEGTEPYGTYPNVEFVTTSQAESDDTTIVRIHVLTDAEVEMKELKAKVNDHEEILSEMMFGGVE